MIDFFLTSGLLVAFAGFLIFVVGGDLWGHEENVLDTTKRYAPASEVDAQTNRAERMFGIVLIGLLIFALGLTLVSIGGVIWGLSDARSLLGMSIAVISGLYIMFAGSAVLALVMNVINYRFNLER